MWKAPDVLEGLRWQPAIAFVRSSGYSRLQKVAIWAVSPTSLDFGVGGQAHSNFLTSNVAGGRGC